MKYLLGAFALVLLVSTLAFGQSYQPLPFPQEANTALQGEHQEGWAADANLPSSMASDEGAAEISPGYDGQGDQFGRGNRINLGSQFPEEVNPVLGRHGDEMAPSWGEQRELGSPFPSAANPARNQ
jgi:hypothetical protein